MEITRTDELISRKVLANRVATVAAAGYVIPSARYCSGIEDFWAAADPSKNTQIAIESSLIAATWIYPVSFIDDFASGGADSPLIRIVYEFYQFRQYGLMRDDESVTPDVFDSKVLAQHADFIAGWLGIKAEFQREWVVPGLSNDVYATARTTPIVQTEDIQNQVICEFVPGVVGYAVRHRESLKIKFVEC